ncbi:MAG: hypothetical protein ACI9WU_005081 [Myxococcota bacterium]|jgi:hypothetical protein
MKSILVAAALLLGTGALAAERAVPPFFATLVSKLPDARLQ